MMTRGREKFNDLLWKINVPAMNKTERNFIFGSVKCLIEHERELSEKQARWLQAILHKYPRQNKIPEYQ
jgi:hypothetical protein